MIILDESAIRLGIEDGELVIYEDVYQILKGNWLTKHLGLKRVRKNEKGKITIEEPFELPRFSADKKDLIEELKRMEAQGEPIQIKKYGTSVFSSRNAIEVCPKKMETEYDVRTLTSVRPYDEKEIYEIGEKKQVLHYSLDDVEKMPQILERARANVANILRQRFFDKFQEGTIDGVFGIISEGGYNENFIIPKEKFVKIYSARTMDTQDHRQNMTHTYDIGYIDIEAAKEKIDKDGKLHLTIPKKALKELDSFIFGDLYKKIQDNGIEMSGIILRLEGVDPLAEVEDGELVWLSDKKTTLARASKCEDGRIKLEDALTFPQFSADQGELIAELKKREDIELTETGNSGFASRRVITVRTKEKSGDYDLKMLKVYSGGDFTRYVIDNNVQDMYYSMEDVELAQTAVEEAKAAIRNKRIERFVNMFNESSIDGVFGVVSEGGHNEKVIIPKEKYVELCRVKTLNTQDHRQNLTHTEDVAYIDVDKVAERLVNGKLHINVPEDMMGRIIGHKGSNIDKVTQDINARGLNIQRIILHPQSRQQWETNLEEIRENIEAQRKKDMEE